MPQFQASDDRIAETHLAWLLWFMMRNGASKPAEGRRIWAYEHVGVDVQVTQWSERKGVQHVEATGRRWSVKFLHGGGKGLRIEDCRGLTQFWRDLTVLRLCEEA